MTKVYLFSAVTCVSFALFSSCEPGTKAKAGTDAADVPGAAVAEAKLESLSNTLKVAGQFEAYQEVDLHAKVSGYIRRINVDIGDRVKAGQVIATLEVPELRAQVSGAQAEVRHSESEIERAKSEVSRAQSNHVALHAAYQRLLQASEKRPGLIAQQEIDDALAKDQNAEGQIEVARSALAATEQSLSVSRADNERVQVLSDYSVVTAPFAGVIAKRYADTGSLIQAGTASNTQAMPVVRLVESDLLRLRMPVAENDVRFIQIGKAVEVHVQAIDEIFSGKIARFSGALDPSTRTLVVEVDIPNPTLKLSPGMYADTVINLEQRNNVVTVPTQAVVQGEGQPYVLTVDNGKIDKRIVTLGIQGPDKVEILSGVSAGDSVVVSGQANYQAGETVRPQPMTVSMRSAGGSR